jgi:Ca2+:H+ antiporter
VLSLDRRLYTPQAYEQQYTYTMLFLDSIKRAARQEAWYGDSNNPFRKTTRRSTFPAQPLDEEKNVGMGQESVLRPVSTEPGPRGESSYSDTREFPQEKTNAEPRPSDPSTDDTIVVKEPSRQPSEEQVARKRFINRLWKRKGKEPEMVDGEEKPKKKRGGIFAGKELKHQPFTLRNQLQNTIGNSWINVLLIAAPVGIALNYAGVNKIVVFVVNFIAIIPLAAMLSFATEELALHVGESLGGLLNASFGYVLRNCAPSKYTNNILVMLSK